MSESHKITIEQARDKIRAAFGLHGGKSVSGAAAPRDPRKAGQRSVCPPSLAKPWLPFKLDAERIACISDVHVPYHSKVALQAAVADLVKRKPDALLINGDLCDFYSISRHVKDPSQRNVKNEMKLVRQCLSWLREEFGKRCRIVLKQGNHEERWTHWLWEHAPEISDDPRMDLSQWIDADKYCVEVVGDQRPIMCGRLPVFHGHELPKGISSPVNPARGAFMRTGGTMLVAHSHRTSAHNEPDWKHKYTSCWSQGCLCDMTPRYAVINKWNYGFAFIEVGKGGDFEISNPRIGPNGEIWN